ncbi:amidohydrolase 3 [Stachybotrys elegans]|uniref:Amidohydrolase 3 n=1 Tax=Stachybotrys elegans TaxID=80388 RepID=A0A8K0WUW4_9HYPO|nr:amidohydrolase 3 [Stachybotrys elegans]
MPALLRWGLTLSVALVAIALAYRLQQPLQASSSTAASAAHCYQSVRTHDADRPTAQCFSVLDGVFEDIWVPDVSIAATTGHVIPGLWDGHGHLLQYGEFLHSVDLFGSQSLDEVKGRIKTYLDANPDAGSKDQWLRGVGWDQTFFGRMPTADDIEKDETLNGLYMMLDRIDVHCTWVSRAVLDLLPSDIPDVPGGEIVHDPGMGVFCDNAMDLVLDLWPKPSPEFKTKTVRTAMAKLNEVGLVGMHDAGATPGNLELFSRLADSEDDWTVRVYSMLECDVRNAYCPDDAVKYARDDGRFAVRSVKLFADGALGSWGSAMLEPYADHPWTSGSLLINASALTQVARSWAAAGFQVNIHAIGDLANRNAVNALEAALRDQCPDEDDLAPCQARHRFRIEHSQIIHPDDQRRILAMGIIPSIQPTHATSDMKYAEDRLGPQRLGAEAYRMKSLLSAGPILGSDFPVEPADPFQGIYAAIARKSPHTGLGAHGSKHGWHMDQALSLDEALWGFTGAVAHGGFMDGKAGVIKPGAFADWVVLDEPIESMDIEHLRHMRVRETWVAGRRVYHRKD